MHFERQQAEQQRRNEGTCTSGCSPTHQLMGGSSVIITRDPCAKDEIWT